MVSRLFLCSLSHSVLMRPPHPPVVPATATSGSRRRATRAQLGQPFLGQPLPPPLEAVLLVVLALVQLDVAPHAAALLQQVALVVVLAAAAAAVAVAGRGGLARGRRFLGVAVALDLGEGVVAEVDDAVVE